MSNDSEIKQLVERLTRPIVGIECHSADEVFDIMADRIRWAFERLAIQPTPQPIGDAVEDMAAALAKVDGCDWKEKCAFEDDPDAEECVSSTCVAAHDEDHDPAVMRDWYRRHAQAALTAYRPYEQAAIQKAVEAERERCAKEGAAIAYNSDHCPDQPDRYYLATEIKDGIRSGIRSGGEG